MAAAAGVVVEGSTADTATKKKAHYLPTFAKLVALPLSLSLPNPWLRHLWLLQSLQALIDTV